MNQYVTTSSVFLSFNGKDKTCAVKILQLSPPLIWRLGVSLFSLKQYNGPSSMPAACSTSHQTLIMAVVLTS